MKPIAFAPAKLGLVFVIAGGISSAAPTADYRFNPAQLEPLSAAQLILLAKPVARPVSAEVLPLERTMPVFKTEKTSGDVRPWLESSPELLRFRTSAPTKENPLSSPLTPTAQPVSFSPL